MRDTHFLLVCNFQNGKLKQTSGWIGGCQGLEEAALEDNC